MKISIFLTTFSCLFFISVGFSANAGDEAKKPLQDQKASLSASGTADPGTPARPKIHIGGTGEVIKGEIDREAVRRVLVANLPSIRKCYENELALHPETYGRLVLAWEIGKRGNVRAPRMNSDSLNSKAIGDCIVGYLKTWRFPLPGKGSSVQIEAYPIMLSN